ncbi:unnamed protein product [Zymoseptoria tritici ST99CH_1E4]|uniref:Cobalamin-independent methionine synthase MetE C-terminal/archaeal domain-containing protein n=1 Tax=Zymoseptoria tritici ST99CH_1E4 TaxID=1276532 RepID=A0A2H1FM62_ZYMTR|nr:unnamed protein product [Zymoseptoria tritici ST99CH_1E4]
MTSSPSSQEPTSLGVHLVGSAPFPSTSTAFREHALGLPSRLKRIPDGETGERHYFTAFQAGKFSAAPEVLVDFTDNQDSQRKDFTVEEVKAAAEKLEAKGGIETGYDVAANESYSVFRKLKEEGVIPKDVKFQVGIPSYVLPRCDCFLPQAQPNNARFVIRRRVASTIGPMINHAFQPALEPLYEASLFRALQNIQAAIPHDQLSIQLDLAVDMGFWEGQYLTPWFAQGEGANAVREYIVAYVGRMMARIEEDVELGVHFCYGDMAHKHFYEPPTTLAITSLLTHMLVFPHRISYIHFPIPVSAQTSLPTFLAPLTDITPTLMEKGLEVYPGVVQFDDEKGTRERIAAVTRACPGLNFGVATECGWGRTPEEQIGGIMELLTLLEFGGRILRARRSGKRDSGEKEGNEVMRSKPCDVKRETEPEP